MVLVVEMDWTSIPKRCGGTVIPPAAAAGLAGHAGLQCALRCSVHGPDTSINQSSIPIDEFPEFLGTSLMNFNV